MVRLPDGGRNVNNNLFHITLFFPFLFVHLIFFICKKIITTNKHQSQQFPASSLIYLQFVLLNSRFIKLWNNCPQPVENFCF